MVVTPSNSSSHALSRETRVALVDVRCRLRASPYLALRRVRCEQHDGQMVLSGRVPTYYLKQLAQAIAMRQPLIRNVVNLIDVVP